MMKIFIILTMLILGGSIYPDPEGTIILKNGKMYLNAKVFYKDTNVIATFECGKRIIFKQTDISEVQMGMIKWKSEKDCSDNIIKSLRINAIESEIDSVKNEIRITIPENLETKKVKINISTEAEKVLLNKKEYNKDIEIDLSKNNIITTIAYNNTKREYKLIVSKEENPVVEPPKTPPVFTDREGYIVSYARNVKENINDLKIGIYSKFALYGIGTRSGQQTLTGSSNIFSYYPDDKDLYIHSILYNGSTNNNKFNYSMNYIYLHIHYPLGKNLVLFGGVNYGDEKFDLKQDYVLENSLFAGGSPYVHYTYNNTYAKNLKFKNRLIPLLGLLGYYENLICSLNIEYSKYIYKNSETIYFSLKNDFSVQPAYGKINNRFTGNNIELYLTFSYMFF